MNLTYTEMTPKNCGISINIEKQLFSEQSPFQKVEILESDFLGRILTLDGLMMTTERDEFFYHELISHVPLLTIFFNIY